MLKKKFKLEFSKCSAIRAYDPILIVSELLKQKFCFQIQRRTAPLKKKYKKIFHLKLI